MPKDFKYDVFLSHSAKDKSRHGDGMRELVNLLKRIARETSGHKCSQIMSHLSRTT